MSGVQILGRRTYYSALSLVVAGMVLGPLTVWITGDPLNAEFFYYMGISWALSLVLLRIIWRRDSD